MAISKIILNGVTQMDVTGVTVQASNLIAPNTAIGADGEPVVGMASQGITPTGIKNISITQNGTTTEDVTNYASAQITVNVPTGSSKAMYIYKGLASRTANSYGATSASVTVAKAGTYTISYVAIRGSSSGTMGTNLHIGSTTGTNNTTWNNGTYGQAVTLTGQNISANTAVTIYATSGSNSRSIYVGQLIVEEQ